MTFDNTKAIDPVFRSDGMRIQEVNAREHHRLRESTNEKFLNTSNAIHTVKCAHDADCADNPDFFTVGLQREIIQ